MRPFAFCPRIDVFEIVREIDGIQLAMDKLSDVPGKVVVPAIQKSMFNVVVLLLRSSLSYPNASWAGRKAEKSPNVPLFNQLLWSHLAA